MSYKRADSEKRKLSRLYAKTCRSYGAGVYYDENKRRLIRYTCHKKQIRIFHNRRFRRYMKSLENPVRLFEGRLESRNFHKKYSDYRWDIF